MSTRWFLFLSARKVTPNRVKLSFEPTERVGQRGRARGAEIKQEGDGEWKPFSYIIWASLQSPWNVEGCWRVGKTFWRLTELEVRKDDGLGGPDGRPASRGLGATLVANWYKVTGCTDLSKDTHHSLSEVRLKGMVNKVMNYTAVEHQRQRSWQLNIQRVDAVLLKDCVKLTKKDVKYRERKFQQWTQGSIVNLRCGLKYW